MELSQEVGCVDVVMCIYTWVHRTHACTTFASKVKVNLYTYNQVQTEHLHGCHSTEEHVITMELSQEVWCVDVVMCIYTWVHRTHAFTNCASKFVSTILASKSVYYFCQQICVICLLANLCEQMFVYSFFTLPWTVSSVYKYSRIHGSPPLFVWGCSSSFASKFVLANVCQQSKSERIYI